MPRISNGDLIALKWQNIHVVSNIKHSAKTWQSSLLYIQQRRIQSPFQRLSKEVISLEVTIFTKKLHLRCLKRFWIRFYVVNHKNHQTAWGKYKPYASFKASYISVLNHSNIFQTSLTTEWNERNQMTSL